MYAIIKSFIHFLPEMRIACANHSPKGDGDIPGVKGHIHLGRCAG